jgi:probable FeS assembly SUF system protein SufT
MHENTEKTLIRDCPATRIPSGEAITLEKGTNVFITQALGGSFTAMTDHGYLVRIEGKDADAIGETPISAPSAEEIAGKSVSELAWDQLKTCFDPEIPVNIVDLGLVYECNVAPLEGEEGQNKATVKFTLTAPGCGMGDYLKMDVKGKLLTVPGIKDADVEVVLDPPWNQSMMSEAARLQLGMM